MAFKSDFQGDDDLISEINMTPLIDVVLVLLIIFMVTSSIAFESGFEVDLPQVGKSAGSEGKSANQLNSAVIVSLLASGEVAVQGKKVELTSATSAIARALASEGTNLVVLEGDRSANLGLAVSLMSMAEEAGAERFAIASE